MPKYCHWYNQEKRREYGRQYQREYQAKKKLERNLQEISNVFRNAFKTLLLIDESIIEMNMLLLEMEVECKDNLKNKSS